MFVSENSVMIQSSTWDGVLAFLYGIVKSQSKSSDVHVLICFYMLNCVIIILNFCNRFSELLCIILSNKGDPVGTESEKSGFMVFFGD